MFVAQYVRNVCRRAEDGAAVWIEKNRQLQKELDWAKEMADRLDRHNQALTRGTVLREAICAYAVERFSLVLQKTQG
jgi:hypothetical protein